MSSLIKKFFSRWKLFSLMLIITSPTYAVEQGDVVISLDGNNVVITEVGEPTGGAPTCTSGQYVNGESCTPCTVLAGCPDGTGTTDFPCPTGATCTDGELKTCPTNFKINPSTTATATECVACETADAGVISTCPAATPGFTCPTSENGTVDCNAETKKVIQCPDRTYIANDGDAEAGGEPCPICTVGLLCNGTQTENNTCPDTTTYPVVEKCEGGDIIFIPAKLLEVVEAALDKVLDDISQNSTDQTVVAAFRAGVTPTVDNLGKVIITIPTALQDQIKKLDPSKSADEILKDFIAKLIIELNTNGGIPHPALGYDLKIEQGSIIITLTVVAGGIDPTTVTIPASVLAALAGITPQQRAEARYAQEQALSLLGMVRSYLDYDTCLITWSDKWQSTGTVSGGGSLTWTGDNEARDMNGTASATFAKSRFCGTIDGNVQQSISETDNNNNKITNRIARGTSSIKVGLKHGISDKRYSKFMSTYTIYGFVSYGVGQSVTKDALRNPVKVRAESHTGATGIGFQGTGKVCSNYDLAVGGHRGEAEGTANSTKVKVDTSGLTVNANLNCPLPSSRFYWSARARYNSGDQSSTNFGGGIGVEVVKGVRLEVDYERTKIESVIDKALSVNLVANLWNTKGRK